jgi:Fic family protein
MDIRVERFKDTAKDRWIHLKKGDSKKGNNCYDILNELANELHKEGKLIELEVLLEESDDGIKYEAASQLLTINSQKAEKALNKITENKGSLPFVAEMTLRHWKEGKL